MRICVLLCCAAAAAVSYVAVAAAAAVPYVPVAAAPSSTAMYEQRLPLVKNYLQYFVRFVSTICYQTVLQIRCFLLIQQQSINTAALRTNNVLPILHLHKRKMC